MYEILVFILTSIVFECLGGMLYGVAVGFNPMWVFASALTINMLSVFAAIFLIGKLLEWRKGLRSWLERRTARGQRIINKYCSLGIVFGMFVLSPIQVAIIGRLIGIQSNKFYPPLIFGTVLSGVVSMGIALGVIKLVLRW